MKTLKIIAAVVLVWCSAFSFAVSDIDAAIEEVEQELKELERTADDNTSVLSNHGGSRIKSVSESLKELADQRLLSGKIAVVDKAMQASKKRTQELRALGKQSANLAVEDRVLQKLGELKTALRIAQCRTRIQKFQDDMIAYSKEAKPLDSVILKRMNQAQMGLDREQAALAILERE
jgi:chaperonin cofactor prefoldin